MFRVLFFGDIVGKIGRKAVVKILPELREMYAPQFVIANAENIAHGIGATKKTIEEVRVAGIDFFTSGNHIWSKKEAMEILAATDPILLRPANYPQSAPGVGARVLVINETPVLMINLIGRVFMEKQPKEGQEAPLKAECPFRALDAILEKETGTLIKIVDFHAEATSEKVVFGHYCDGRVSAVIGTHTHVQTADSRILPKGTAHIADVGMVGLRDSAIGADLQKVTQMFLTDAPQPKMHDVPDTGIAIVSAVVVDIDPATGRAYSIERVQKEIVV